MRSRSVFPRLSMSPLKGPGQVSVGGGFEAQAHHPRRVAHTSGLASFVVMAAFLDGIGDFDTPACHDHSRLQRFCRTFNTLLRP